MLFKFRKTGGTIPPGVRYIAVPPRLFLILLLPFLCSCQPNTVRTPTAPIGTKSADAPFLDVAEKAGIHFQQSTGATGKFYYVEETGSGCAFVDYDNDGYPDIVIVQSGTIPREPGEENPANHCALYHNNGDGTFTDVTKGSGLDRVLSYGQGIAVGDYDNDGYDDLYITGYGGNYLFHNEHGTGKFTDVTATAGVGDTDQGARYSTSAAWGDYDNDGKLDLYVCHYAKWKPETNIICKSAKAANEYCTPDVLDPDIHRLYHNNGDGTFTDVTQKSGIGKVPGHGLGVVWTDYDNDGYEDIFVTNDLSAQTLWHNNGNGTFTNKSEEVGTAYDAGAQHMAGMGIGLGDYDNSGRESLFVTNFSQQPNTLFKNNGNGFFEDASMAANLALPHMKYLAFGCDFIDYDADGWKDLIIGNGHVVLSIAETSDGTTYKERKQLFHNDGTGRYVEITNSLGDLETPTVTRGLATGDYDNDGRIDFLAVNQNAPVQLFHNEDKSPNHWISFKTVGTKSSRDGYGAKITVSVGGQKRYSEVHSSSSYLSHSDSRVYFGLASASKVDKVTIHWLGGKAETISTLTADKCYVLTEGKGVTGTVPGKRKAAP